MRIYLILMIALALVASYGCSSKKSAGRTPDETAKLARGGGNSSASENDNSSISNPGMEAERKRREAERNGTSEDETSEDDSKDSEDAGEEEAGEGDEGEEAENKPEKPASTRSAARRRRRVQTPQMGGGNMEEERIRREAEKAAKGQQASNPGNQSGLGSRQRPTSEVEADEKTEEKFVSFYDRAVKAFAMDYDPEGFQFLYAHYLTDENAFIDHPLGWYDGVSEPRVALRWGVAIDYNDGGFEGEPPVIGDPVADDSGSRDNNRGRGNRRGGNSDFGAPSGATGRGSMGVQGGRGRPGAGNRQRGGEPGSGQQRRRGNVAEQIRSPEEELDHYTGDFGEKLVRRYEMRRRHEDAYYGVVMRDIDKASAGDETEEKDEEEQAEEAPRRRGSGDDFGTMGGGSNVDMNEERRRREQARSGRGNRGGSSSSDEDFEAEASSLAPGLMFVGVGNKSQMLANAKNLNLDLLVMFEVKIRHSERRNGETSTKSNTRLVVYSVKDGKVLDTDSKSLSNLAVATAREKDRDDPVELELDKVFGEMADTVYKSQDLPEIDAGVATKRYQFLLSKKKYDNPLPVLVEIKQYVDAGLVSQNDYIAACEQLLGDASAQDLIDGDMKKKEKALEDYLPGNYEVNISTGEDGEDGDDFR